MPSVPAFPVLPADWEAALAAQMHDHVGSVVRRCFERATAGPVLPPVASVLRACELTPVDRVQVVVLGQDPYHGPGQANGLAFSVHGGIRFPPSLRNILTEAAADMRGPVADLRAASGDLTVWAQQGVLLLNTVLTVAPGLPASHAGLGWEELTEAMVRAVAAAPGPRVFVLWGRHAAAYASFVHRPEHRVLTSAHPSPLSAYRGFFGSRPFSEANAWLTAHGADPIAW
jgi:uracil-DNA glycosylase